MDSSYFRRIAILITIAVATTSVVIGKITPSEFPLAAKVLPPGVTAKEFQGVQMLFNMGPLLPSDRHTSNSQLKGRSVVQGQMDTLYRPTEILDKDWEDLESAWLNTMMVTMTYDTEGREVDRLGRAWFGIAWENLYNAQFTYNESGRLTRIISKFWNGGVWQTSSKDTVIYNIYGNPVEERIEIFNGSSWTPFQRYLISYDGNLRPTNVVGQNWAVTDWVNSFKYTLTYDGNDHNTEFLNQSWSGGAWTNNLRETYSYSTNGARTEEVDQFWAGDQWNNDLRFTWTYDGSDFLIQVLNENWKTSAWVNDVRDVYNNDTEGIPGDILTQYWDGFAWVDDKILYISRDGGNIVEEFTQSWNGAAWVNFHITSYSWQAIITPATVTQHYDMSDKWNMVSVPLDVADHSKSVVYPTSVSNAFTFDAGYVASPMLENGKGYWLKFDAAQTVSVTGVVLTEDTIDVVAGWNMVGSIGVPIPAASVGSIPGGLVSSSFFGFNAGYQAATNIEPGKGYWVKMAEAGKLVYSSAGNVPVASRLRMELEDNAPPEPPAEETANDGAPGGYRLDQNFPNPFNPVTTIRYVLPTGGQVTLSLFNMLGQEVAVLVNEVQDAGDKTVYFDAGTLPSGVYTYRIAAGAFTNVKKLVFIK